MTSLVIIGMNNPQGRPPLDTQPRGGSGHRLWLMVTARTGVSEAEWLDGTARINLCSGEDWTAEEAKQNFEAVQDIIAPEAQILHLGRDVLNIAKMCDAPLCGRRDRYWFLPHPSGRNRWYNEQMHLDAATLLLRDFWNTRFE